MKPYIWRIHDIPWIWSILLPDMRFVCRPYPDDGYCWCWMERWVLEFCLLKEYERQVYEEMRDPEWPSPSWEAKEDLMYEAIGD